MLTSLDVQGKMSYQYTLRLRFFPRTNLLIVGFEVFTAVVLKSIFFWDMTPCSPLNVNRRFGGTYHIHIRGKK
jgi:hypothetical protein